SSASCAARTFSSQLAVQRSSASVIYRPDEQFCPKNPSLSTLSLYIERRPERDASARAMQRFLPCAWKSPCHETTYRSWAYRRRTIDERALAPSARSGAASARSAGTGQHSADFFRERNGLLQEQRPRRRGASDAQRRVRYGRARGRRDRHRLLGVRLAHLGVPP